MRMNLKWIKLEKKSGMKRARAASRAGMARALEMDESTETVAGSVLGLRLTLIFLPLVLRRAIDWLRA